MKLKIRTSEIQELYGSAKHCASKSKNSPLTTLIEVKFENGVFSLTTTNDTDYLTVKSRGQIECDSGFFAVVVSVDMFGKLIEKVTSEFVTLEVTDSALQIQGNGKYSIKIPLDGEGEPITFPVPSSEGMNKLFEQSVPLSNLRRAVQIGKVSVAASTLALEFPILTAFFADGERVVTSDSTVVTISRGLEFDQPVLLSSSLLNLVTLSSEAEVKFEFYDKASIVKAGDLSIFSYNLFDLGDYPIQGIDSFVDLEFPNSCKLSKQILQEALDRISLFIEKSDSGAVVLSFTEEGLIVSDSKGKATERVSYQTGLLNIGQFACNIDAAKLKTQLNAQDENLITVLYGNNDAIRVVGNAVSQVIALNVLEGSY